MALLNPCVMDGKKFHWSHMSKVGSAEASDLGYRAGQVPMGQLYDDACDLGITLSNVHTTHWYFVDAMYSGDDHVEGWIYAPCPETIQKHPHLNGWKLHILND